MLSHPTDPDRFRRAEVATSYLNKEERGYIHLLDGGISDNLGLYGPMVAFRSHDSWLFRLVNQAAVKMLLFIVVDEFES
jgi:hypothetical protein